jgi:zinc transport system substrate-binding protein
MAVLMIVFTLAACNSATQTESDGENTSDKLKIYTTIYPMQYFTERIGGDYVSTENLVPPGADAHSVEVTTKTMVDVAESDAFIYTGTGVEGFADAVIDSLEKEDVIIVNASENVSFIGALEREEHNEEAEETTHEEHDEENHSEETAEEHEEHEEHTSDQDPHVWLDPERAIVIAENIKNALVELKPARKQEFEDNFSALKTELEDLDSEFNNMVDSSKTKTFIVSHSAYGYWEDAYGLKQIGISGLSPTDEPSQKQLSNIIDLVKENDLKYIFFEQNLENKVAEIVKNETGTEALTLHNLESITDENIENSEDYFIIMKKNIEALKQALN